MEVNTVINTRTAPHLTLDEGDDLTRDGSSSSSAVLAAQAAPVATGNNLRYLIAMIVGTGGAVNVATDWTNDFAAATGSVILVKVHVPEQLRITGQRSVSNAVATIKGAFGFSISQLAQVLQVRRPTIYTWLDPDTSPDVLRKDNQERVNGIFEFAALWNELHGLPVGDAQLTMDINGKTLIDWLSQDNLQDPRIRAALMDLREMIQAQGPASYGRELRKRGFAEVPRSRRA